MFGGQMVKAGCGRTARLSASTTRLPRRTASRAGTLPHDERRARPARRDPRVRGRRRSEPRRRRREDREVHHHQHDHERVYAYIFNRNRLMARADMQGSEITRIDTSRIPTRPVNRRGARGVTWQDRHRRGDVPSIRDGGLGIDDRERTLNCEVPTRGWRRTDQARGRHGRMSAIPAPTRRRRKHGEPVGTDLGHQAGVRDVGSRDAAIGPRGVRAARRRVPR